MPPVPVCLVCANPVVLFVVVLCVTYILRGKGPALVFVLHLATGNCHSKVAVLYMKLNFKTSATELVELAELCL